MSPAPARAPRPRSPPPAITARCRIRVPETTSGRFALPERRRCVSRKFAVSPSQIRPPVRRSIDRMRHGEAQPGIRPGAPRSVRAATSSSRWRRRGDEERACLLLAASRTAASCQRGDLQSCAAIVRAAVAHRLAQGQRQPRRRVGDILAEDQHRVGLLHLRQRRRAGRPVAQDVERLVRPARCSARRQPG